MKKDRILRMLKKKISNNSGMALVTVIVACGFIAALVSILLMTTLVNFKMKVVNDRGKDTFYSAEQVLDEINVGLQRRVSDSISFAYAQVMENYDTDTNEQKKLRIKTLYYENLWNYLEYPGSSHQMYDVAKLEEFLKDSTKWHAYSGSGATGDGFGAIVRAVNISDTGAVSEAGYGDMITYTDGGIVLKNVKVYYKDYNGFVSVIQTDIRLNLPKFEFAKSSATVDVADYCFIADSGAVRETAGNLTFDGNIYADYFRTKNVNTEFGENTLVVVKNDISLDDGSLTTTSGVNIWASDINLKSADMDTKGVVNLSNDLNLTGSGASAKVSGEYNGYGYDNSNADKSSAILMNGKNASIDFSNVTKLTIAGRAFLGMKSVTSSGSSAYDLAAQEHKVEGASYENIFTGESIAAKSDQLLYLIPAEAIGVDEKAERRSSLFNANPLTKVQYNQIVEKVTNDNTLGDASPTKYKLVSETTQMPSFGGTTLDQYTNWSIYKHEVKVQADEATTGGSLVYLYIKFDDSLEGVREANRFFQESYGYNENSKYSKTYVKNIKLPDTNIIGEGKFNRVGRVYVNDPTDVDGDLLGIQAESNINDADTRDIIINNFNESVSIFKAYTTKLIPNESELSGTIVGDRVVFDNVVTSKARLEAYIDRATTSDYNNVHIEKSADGKTLTFEEHEGDIAGPIKSRSIVSVADVEVNQDDLLHLVITSGDVNVKATNYQGVILCDGTMKFSGTSNQVCQRVPDMVYRCLEMSYEDGGRGYPIKTCLNGGDEYIFDAAGNSTTSLTGLVTYENWKKE